MGLRNNRAFALFCFYTAIIAVQYVYSSINYYYSITPEEFKALTTGWLVYWMSITFLIGMFTISLVALTAMQLWMAVRNITTL